MIQYGTSITTPNDPLSLVSLDQVKQIIQSPNSEVCALLHQLRQVRTMDEKRYHQLKYRLPYFVAGRFNPPYRKTENFGFTEYFFIDLDHLHQKELTPEQLKERLKGDSRVVLLFVSPSEDGLKLLFRLSERCYDPGEYALFYKLFLRQFAQQYDLNPVIDPKTSDVARACFVSHDPEVVYNPHAEAVSLKQFVDTTNLLEVNHLLKEEQKNEKSVQTPKETIVPDEEVFAFIKSKLNPKAPNITRKMVYVPEQLNEILDELTRYLEQAQLHLYEIVDIQYGKKLRIRAGHQLSEVNLFFGKRGFSVVVSPKAGTSSTLNHLVADYINQFIDMI